MKYKNKKITSLTFTLIGAIILLLLPVVPIAMGASGSRILQEIVGPDQSLKRVQGMPVIISKKKYSISVSPKSIISQSKEPVVFTLVIVNPHTQPLQFSMDDIKVRSEGNDLKILDSDEVLAEARKGFSKNTYDMNKEQEKQFEMFVEDTMQRLKEKLLKSGTIASKGQTMGQIHVQVPSGTESLTIEIMLEKEKHLFNFQIIES